MTTVLKTAADLFAGAGGSTLGATQAGVNVLCAANHWPAAVACHQQNHPNALHYTQDLHQANFHEWPDFDLMLASPSCQGSSTARGKDRPHHDIARSTAWAVVACAAAKRPKALIVENVPEMTRWRLYPQWKSCLEQLGYSLAEQVLNAADFGVPQSRRRLFITGVKASRPAVVVPPMTPHSPANSIIDQAQARWSLVKKPGRAAATLKRYERGKAEHGESFLMAYFGKERGGRSLEKPLGTILTRDRYAVVEGDRMRMMSIGEYRDAQGLPRAYVLPDKHKDALQMIGNSVVPPVMAACVRQVDHHLSLCS